MLAGVRAVAKTLPENAIIVALMSDHGNKYFEKIFSDKWMREKGLLDT